MRTEHKPAETPVPVKFNDLDTSLLQDYSSIWDPGLGSQHDNPLVMLNAFQRFLEGLTDEHAIEDCLRQVTEHEPPAVIWRRLLAAGATQPTTIG